MKKIAELAGVSLGTVSHVLNDTARVREPLRKRVMDAVHATGYQPSQLARGLRRDKTNILAMIIPDILNPFFPGVVRGAEDVAFSNGYRLVLCNTDNDHGKEVTHLNALRTYLPSGLIVIPSDFSELTAQTETWRRAGAAVVCVDRLPRNWSGDSVTINNAAGAFEAASYLLGLGHRRIACITGPLHLTNSQDRLKGFRRALRASKIDLAPGFQQESGFDRAGGYAKTKLLLRMVPRPTAILACNDMIALGALLAIREERLHCPDDISIVGFDGLDLTETTTPQLSSVYQSPYQLGATAVQLALDRVADKDSPVRHIVLKTELRVRESVAPPRNDAVKSASARSRAAGAPMPAALQMGKS
ncbi:MAG TPA: LacI family DNA-binding transcriptional regulator [Acidobacteriaceae bacterium]|nr:LacI family DNA-binding transcriptional regulator [Acidobacteriaceae bacterium]